MTATPSTFLKRPEQPGTRRARDVFAAIDFETADPRRDSACAVAIVRVEGGLITAKQSLLIRPPRPSIQFSHIHGIRWEHVVGQPKFAEAWPRIAPLLDGVGTLYAHNAAFDRSVLEACCTAAGLRPPAVTWGCTVALARQTWGLPGNKLPEVCARLKIALEHHNAESDAEACARIVLAARARGR